jgi:predicted FMN-binding regulatory protein PaiB
LLLHLNELANQQEQVFEKPWPVIDAPADYIAALSQSIKSIEISIEAIEGKWKSTRTARSATGQGVITGLTVNCHIKSD